MRKSLIALKLSPKGGNYKRCHKLKNEFLFSHSKQAQAAYF